MIANIDHMVSASQGQNPGGYAGYNAKRSEPKHVTAIVDLQFGSTGKGLFAGYLSQQQDFDVVVSANMPNAGHTFVDSDGDKWVNKVLPSGVYSPSLKYIGIGPGAVFDPLQLVKEINELRKRRDKMKVGIEGNQRVIIHPAAAVLSPWHKELEQGSLSKISSTMQGSMEAMHHKMRRNAGDTNVVSNKGLLAGYYTEDGTHLQDLVIDHAEWLSIMSNNPRILVEGSQGYSLGINAGFYPYCTSRDCTAQRLLADCAVPVINGLTVLGTARVHPIRVGNTADGNSGPCYRDQREMTWEEVGQTPETTTVTGRIRRVFSFSELQVLEAMMMNRVDAVFLNFCNYDIREANRVRKVIDTIGSDLMRERGHYVFDNDSYKMVHWMGFGPAAEDVVKVVS